MIKNVKSFSRRNTFYTFAGIIQILAQEGDTHTEEMNKKGNDYRGKTPAVRALTVLLFVGVAAILLRPLLPMTESRQQRNAVSVDYRWGYALTVNGKPVLYMQDITLKDWSSAPFSTINDSLTCNRQTLNGTWTDRWLLIPSCRGRIRIPDTAPHAVLDSMNRKVKEHVETQKDYYGKRLRILTHATMETDDYLTVHNVTDEGYNTIASYATYILEWKRMTARALAALQQITDKDSVAFIITQHYNALMPCDSARTDTLACHLTNKKRRQDIIIQTNDKKTPKNAFAHYLSKPGEQPPTPQPKGEYDGEYSNGKREGHGILSLPDGTYYNGMWENDMRNGFGFAIDTLGNLRAGEWKDDKFQGERLTYTSDRIYGIDISRYQHDIGKKHYAINWQKVRISHLGNKSSKRISGAVDYPVRFCYIKSTEGTSIRNKYFASDYSNAKKYGIRTGAYHFFSTKSGGTAQANYFLKTTYLRKGDLPPVLDVEPSASQIRAMGGTAALFSNIRAWLRAVEQRCGVKPILYVGQTFVNKYLVDAPDIKRDYQVWIARYGEFKPDVKLVIWQLCPDGRVNGIRGAVDINVFNGYGDQFDEFLENNCIP